MRVGTSGSRAPGLSVFGNGCRQTQVLGAYDVGPLLRTDEENAQIFSQNPARTAARCTIGVRTLGSIRARRRTGWGSSK